MLLFLGFNTLNVNNKADFSGRTSVLSVGNERTPLSTSDKSWRITNRLVVEYRVDIASRLDKLVSRKALADDPEVVQLAADVIDHVPLTAAVGIKRSREIVKTPQAKSVEKLTNRKVSHCRPKHNSKHGSSELYRTLSLMLSCSIYIGTLNQLQQIILYSFSSHLM